MDETTQWLQAEAKKRVASSVSYEQRARYAGFEAFLDELAQRLETAQGELDGRTWDHEGWRD